MKSVANAMEYEDMKLNKPSKLSVRQAVKSKREVNINHMTSWQVLAFLGFKHRLGVVIMYGVLITAVLIIKL